MIKEKLSDAIERMNPGDEWKSSNFHAIMAGDKIMITCQGAKLNMYDGISRELGEIIRAEPKILTAEEIKEKVLSELVQINIPASSMVLKSARLGVENGQIKEWKRLKPLINALKATREVFGYNTGEFGQAFSLVMQELGNLTPPWETEK